MKRKVTLMELYLYELFIEEGMNPQKAAWKAKEAAITFEEGKKREV